MWKCIAENFFPSVDTVAVRPEPLFLFFLFNLENLLFVTLRSPKKIKVYPSNPWLWASHPQREAFDVQVSLKNLRQIVRDLNKIWHLSLGFEVWGRGNLSFPNGKPLKGSYQLFPVFCQITIEALDVEYAFILYRGSERLSVSGVTRARIAD